jgi:Fe2+ transport system protein B
MAQVAILAQRRREVRVDKQKLKATLAANLKQHEANYKEAVEGYKEQAKKKLNKAHEKAKKALEENVGKLLTKIEGFDPSERLHQTDHVTLVESISMSLAVPRNFADHYRAAIAMAEWETAPTIVLSGEEFQCFVRDIWDWTDEFRMSTAAYMKAK